MKIKVFGERNTGTNFLEQLLRANLANHEVLPGNMRKPWAYLSSALAGSRLSIAGYPVSESFRDRYFALTQSSQFGWKHRALGGIDADNRRDRDALYVVAVRHPLTWLLSMHRRPYLLGSDKPDMTFGEFLATPCRSVRREGYPGDQYPNVVEIWNFKVRSYLANVAGATFVRHEDLVREPELELRRLCRSSGIEPPATFVNRESSVKADQRTQETIRDELAAFDHEQRFTQQQFADLRHLLDPALLDTFGYSLCSPYWRDTPDP